MIGKKFHKLTVLKYIGKKYGGNKNYLCLCECGNKTEVILSQINAGTKKSCGCSRYKDVSMKNKTHGLSRTRQYKIWFEMKRRCDNENNKNYGGRGIGYDEKWKTFQGFRDDMKDGYHDDLTIDRVDNDGNYCKDNCRRSTYREQANNTRNTKHINIDGETKNLSERLRHTGLSSGAFYTRLNNGRDYIDALTTPQNKAHKIKYQGREMTLSERSDLLGLKRGTLYRRIYIKKYPLDIALSSDMYDGQAII